MTAPLLFIDTETTGLNPDCLTPTTEAIARALPASLQPAPVQRWELPAAPGPAVGDPEPEGEAW